MFSDSLSIRKYLKDMAIPGRTIDTGVVSRNAR